MAQETPTSLRSLLGKLLDVFEKVHVDSLRFHDCLAALQGIYRAKPDEHLGDLSLDDGSQRNLFHLLAVCLNETRSTKSDHSSEAFSILADASRDPKWRQRFGACQSRSTNAGWPPDPKHHLHAYSHEQWSRYESESVLQVAVRSLHPHYAAYLGQAAYHALRLISNCCADNDANKRIVLECGGIELLLRCANSRLWPEIVVAALWNICAESEVQAGVDSGSATENGCSLEVGPKMCTIACAQLSLSSTAECDDSNGKLSLLSAKIENGQRHKNIIKELLGLAEVVEDKARKEMAADLLEKASCFVLWPAKSSAPTGYETMIPEATRLTRPDVRPKDFLAELLTGLGRVLAMSSPECNCDVTSALAIVLSRSDVQQELITQDLVEAFLEVPSWKSTDEAIDQPDDPDIQTSLFRLQQSLFKTVYDVSALPDFMAKYGKGTDCPDLIIKCIDALGNVSNLRESKAFNTIPAASACIVLANLTKSTEYALFLVQRQNVHLSLGLILRQREDSTTLFPALALLDRLAIPPENKTAMFDAGVFYELPRFLIGFDILPSMQREAVSAVRKIMAGYPKHVSGIGACISIDAKAEGGGQRTERTQEQSGLVAALNLFRRTSDVETKLEVARLLIEVCRTFLHSTRGHPEEAEDAVRLAFGSASDIADCIAYVATDGTSRDVQGEGWFGLAILSTWGYGRPLVLECLGQKEVQMKLMEALKGGERAFVENISLMLTKLKTSPSYLVLSPTRDFLEDAASMVGLPPIWPVLAPAA